ncbi:hypothetical protein D932_02400 [Enterococcus casseliflavus 14-MB-W-14]|nr:hypothetical protein D932_02400 [Enterococcus casseliflavus 14-MB-W-14]
MRTNYAPTHTKAKNVRGFLSNVFWASNWANRRNYGTVQPNKEREPLLHEAKGQW